MDYTDRIDALLEAGELEEAKRAHREHVDEEFARAERGETICLSDLIGAKERIDLAIIDGAAGREGRRRRDKPVIIPGG